MTRPCDHCAENSRFKQKISQEPLNFFSPSSKKDPKNADANLWLSVVYDGCHKDQLSLQYLERAVELDPSLTWGHLFLGGRYFKMGEYGTAIMHLEQHLQNHPKDETALNLCASAYLQIGNSEKAKELFERMIQNNPDSVLGSAAWHTSEIKPCRKSSVKHIGVK